MVLATQISDSTAVPYRAWFQCMHCPDQHYSLTEVVYRCKACGGLLEVRHDMAALKALEPDKWRTLFDRRYMRTHYPYGSSVWGKKEMVCPAVADENVVSLYEGGSNMFWAERLGRQLGVEDLWVKQCGDSHTGSFKDIGMTVLVSLVKQIIATGQQVPAMVCASSGDTSAALAAYGAAAGIPVVVLLPRGKVTAAQMVQPLANGALTLFLDTDFDGCMRLAKALSNEEQFYYLANSMNPLRLEGQKTVAVEIVQQDDWTVPDWIVVPGGNLGNISALGKGFLEMREMGLIEVLPRLVVAQAAHADPLYQSYLCGFETFEPQRARKTLASAIQIGAPVSWERAIRVLKTFDGVVECASEDELADAAAKADLTGLFACPHTGVALAALFKLVAQKVIAPEDKVVVVSTAHGLKFPEFKTRYHAGDLEEFGVVPRFRQIPHEIGAEYGAVQSFVLRHLDGLRAKAGSLSVAQMTK